MNSSESNPLRILASGGITADISWHLNVGKLIDTKDTAISSKKFPNGIGIDTGGGASNFVQYLQQANLHRSNPFGATLLTQVGDGPTQEDLESKSEQDWALAELDQFSHKLVTGFLERRRVNLLDALEEIRHVVPFNGVNEYVRGRHISKMFSDAVNDYPEHIQQMIEQEVSKDTLVFIDPAKPLLGSLVADKVRSYDVPMIVDYGSKEWPANSLQSDRLCSIFDAASLIIVPDDAIFMGMRSDRKNSRQLFSILSKTYSDAIILMSNGGKPVQLWLNGEKISLPVYEPEHEAHTGTRYNNGKGDARDAWLALALMVAIERERAKGNNDDVKTIIQNNVIPALKAAMVATYYKIMHGDEWLTHAHDKATDSDFHDLFSDMKPEHAL